MVLWLATVRHWRQRRLSSGAGRSRISFKTFVFLARVVLTNAWIRFWTWSVAVSNSVQEAEDMTRNRVALPVQRAMLATVVVAAWAASAFAQAAPAPAPAPTVSPASPGEHFGWTAAGFIGSYFG